MTGGDVWRQGDQQVQWPPLPLHPGHAAPGLWLWSVCLSELRRSSPAALEKLIADVQEKNKDSLQEQDVGERAEASCAGFRPASWLVEVHLS